MSLFIARHGQSVANKKKIFAGQKGGKLDSPLTSKGKLQAARLGLKLRSRREPIDIIISSPLKRAKQTAKIIKKTSGVRGSIIFSAGIEEFDVGSLAGKKLGVTGDAFWETMGMEDPERFQKRVVDTVKKFYKRYPDKNILFVAHSGVIRVLEAKEAGLAGREFRSMPHVSNIDLKRIKLDKL